MQIYDLPKDIKKYEAIVKPVLFDARITAKPVIEGYHLYFRVYFLDEATNFFIDKQGRVVFIDKDEEIMQIVPKETFKAEFQKYLDGGREEEVFED